MTYCGIDMGKKSSNFCLVDEKRNVLKEGKVKNTREDLRKAFGRMPPMRICVEASTKSFWMADRLRELGHTLVVVDPGRTKTIGAGMIKNDRLDARVLAALCQADLMAAVDQPQEKERLARTMVVARDGLVRSRVSLMVMVRSILDSEGFELRHATAEGFPAAVEAMLPQRCETSWDVGAYLGLVKSTYKCLRKTALNELCGLGTMPKETPCPCDFSTGGRCDEPFMGPFSRPPCAYGSG